MSPSKCINEVQNSWLKFLKWNFLIFWCDLSVHHGWRPLQWDFPFPCTEGRSLCPTVTCTGPLESWKMGWSCYNFRDLTRKMTHWLLHPFRWHQENWPEVHFEAEMSIFRLRLRSVAGHSRKAGLSCESERCSKAQSTNRGPWRPTSWDTNIWDPSEGAGMKQLCGKGWKDAFDTCSLWESINFGQDFSLYLHFIVSVLHFNILLLYF